MDTLTKEEKDPLHFRLMAFTITTPRLLENLDVNNGNTILSDGSIERPQTKFQKDSLLESTEKDLPILPAMTIQEVKQVQPGGC